MDGVMIAVPRVTRVVVRIDGDSPLILQRFTERALGKIMDKETKQAAKAKEVRNPKRDFEEAQYRLEDGRCGILAAAFKICAVSAARMVDGLHMTVVRTAFSVPAGLLPLVADAPRMRRDVVRLANRNSDIRFRPEWFPWAVELPLFVNESVLTVEQVCGLLQNGGFGVGVGEWRPESKATPCRRTWATWGSRLSACGGRTWGSRWMRGKGTGDESWEARRCAGGGVSVLAVVVRACWYFTLATSIWSFAVSIWNSYEDKPYPELYRAVGALFALAALTALVGPRALHLWGGVR